MRKLLIIIVCCTVALLGGYAGYRSYKVWKQKRLITLAREFIANGDGKSGMLSLREALTVNPLNVNANRLAAEISQAARSPESLLWRSRVVELAPKSVNDRLALAETAMMFRDFVVATNALEGISNEGKSTAAYHNMAGAVAAAANQLPEAAAHFQAAIRLEPQNRAPLLNLAVIQLHRTNESATVEARATLQALSSDLTNSYLRCQALRELVFDALRSHHEDSAMALSKELLLQTNSMFRDRLLRLDVLRTAKSAELKSTMLAFEKEAATNSVSIYELGTWQQSHGSVQEGLIWLQSLPADVRTNQPVALLMAESMTALKDWRQLQTTLEHQNWQTSEFIRHAFLARGFRARDLTDSADSEWNKALITAGSQKMSRIMLLRMAAQWGWQRESEDLLWTIVNQYPNERWAVNDLTRTLYVSGRTRSLLALFSQQVKAKPKDLDTRNNLAMTALLLDARELKPHDLAREVYEKSPTNSSFASTYAYSLLLQKKNVQALTVLEQLNPQELENPAISGYYGIILQANGNHAKAKKYLELTSKTKILPEERKLFDRALAGGSVQEKT